jgi:metallo-beta-lactamase class B
MFKKLLVGVGVTALFAGAVLAQDVQPGARQGADQAPGGQARGAGRGAGGAAGAGRGGAIPTEEQWNNSAEAQAYVAKAKEIAGNDPDLQFDEAYNCTPAGTPQGNGPSGGGPGGDDAVSGNAGIPFVPMPSGTAGMPPMHVFDNLWWFGIGRVGSWLITTNKGYILFDTLDSPEEEQAVLLDQMKKEGLDPNKIKYVLMGHFHIDHTGGGHLIQTTIHPTPVMLMGRDDWPLYFKALSEPGGQGARLKDKTPMTRDRDAEDGEKLTVGDTTVTLYSMPGHTPGSTGMIFNAKYQGKLHPVLLVTASSGAGNLRNREAFIGGFEHIWNAGIKAKVETVMQSHPNYNINTISRMEYANAHPGEKNPLLYGVEKTRKYLEINRACAQARLAAMGW